MRPARMGRDLVAGVRPTPRVVHLGLGAFHKAHQAALTWASEDHEEWGIRAFAGRSGVDAALAAQDGVFTMLSRSGGAEAATVIGSIVAVHASSSDEFSAAVADRATAVVTITVTEGGWHLDAAGAVDLDRPSLRADLDALRADPRAPVYSLWGRLYASLAARAAAGAGPVALVPCDNIPSNGAVLREGLVAFTDALRPGGDQDAVAAAACVSTSVDRITPRTPTDAVRRAARRHGFDDPCAVITERAFAWTLAGDFPAGRPAWETAGAEFVADIALHDRRKLWLLNGAHLVLAYAGRLAGHRTTSQAMADGSVRMRLERYWSEAAAVLGPIPTADYLRGLRQRLADAAVDYPLSQIMADSAQKLRVRIVPVVRARHVRGLAAPGCAELVAHWVRESSERVESALHTIFGAHVPEGFADAVRSAMHATGIESSS